MAIGVTQGVNNLLQATGLRKIFDQMLGRIFIPPTLLESTEKKVLHLSDTPTTLYPAIQQLISSLKPDVVIHTGDLADDIKLENNPHLLAYYSRSIVPLLAALENSQAEQLFIVPGNHDHVDVITQHIQKIELLPEGSQLQIGCSTFGLAHRLKKLPQQAEFHLYGHNFRQPLHEQQDAHYLNGLNHIHVILLPSNRIFKISYPWSTNHDRRMTQNLPKTI